jgi:hypothetical protein
MKQGRIFLNKLIFIFITHLPVLINAQSFNPFNFEFQKINVGDSAIAFDLVLNDTIINKTIVITEGFKSVIYRTEQSQFKMIIFSEGQVFFILYLNLTATCYNIEIGVTNNLLVNNNTSNKMIHLAQNLILYGDKRDLKKLKKMSSRESGYSVAPFIGTILCSLGVTNHPRLELVTNTKAFQVYQICRID